MKKFRANLTVVLDIDAETQEEVEDVIQEMHYEFTDPLKYNELITEIIDFEILEVEN